MAELFNEEQNNVENEVESEITENELPEDVELMGYDDDDEGIIDDNDDDDDENVKIRNPAENIPAENIPSEIVQNDDDDDDANPEGLDEQTIRTFLEQLIHLQNQTILKKKENRLIPSVNHFFKLDLEQKGEQISPSITRHLLHICDLIVRKKIDIDVDTGDRNVMEYIATKDCPAKDIRFTFVEDMHIHGYIRKAVQQLQAIKKSIRKKMGDEVKRLALIDAGKFNALMEMFTENNNRQKLLSDAKRSAEEAGLIESRATVLKSVKNKSSTAGIYANSTSVLY